ncbi:MAG: DNA mismatch repair endonuclease MutL [Oligoflexales bacterium]|nr:DNA mismatch repair endonuclease MutL [Oligoflexales bacterium]
MRHIYLLKDEVINKIAAGEVVERPSSVVKELVENAIDAKASHIHIELEEGGKKRISVTDDGIGMSPEDCLFAVQRHATSKIKTEEDLFAIDSMGFRGEALASISAISRFTLISRPKDLPVGTRLYSEGGVRWENHPWSGRAGTQIHVHDLFFNIPAREKFLKAYANEYSHCVELIQAMSLAHPELSFTLLHNGKETFFSPACLDEIKKSPESEGAFKPFGEAVLRKRAAQVYDPELIAQFLYTIEENQYGCYEALISPPGLDKATARSIFNFTNRRWVKDKTLQYGVIRGYQSHLLKGRYPSVIGFLSCDPSLVDVNAHPAKFEVRFQYPGEIQGLISLTIRKALRGYAWALPQTSVLSVDKQTSESHSSTKSPVKHWVSEVQNHSDQVVPSSSLTNEVQYPVGGVISSLKSNTTKETPSSRAPLSPPPFFAHKNEQTDIQNPSAALSKLQIKSDFQYSRDDFPPFPSPQIEKDEDVFETPSSSLSHMDRRFISSPEPSLTKVEVKPDQLTKQNVSLFADLSFRPEPSLRKAPSGKIPWDELVYMGSMARCYLFFEWNEDQMLVVDQHAFHERILYEKFMSHSQASDKQALIIPEEVPLSMEQRRVLFEMKEDLESYGFELHFEGDGDGGYVEIRAVPVILRRRNVQKMLCDLSSEGLDDLSVNTQSMVHPVIASMACHAAIRAGEHLGENELKALLQEAKEVDFYLNCPHGRRVFRWFQKSQIEAWFDR